MKYLLLIRGESMEDGPEPTAEDMKEINAWVDEMTQRGIRLIGDRIRPSKDAVGVRVRNGKVVTTDGPFAEAKEQMGGFDVLECRDLDEAIEVASKHPAAKGDGVELRPFWPLDL